MFGLAILLDYLIDCMLHYYRSSFLEKKDNMDFDSPYDMAKTLASQRYEIAGLLEKQGILAADVKSRDAYIGKVEGYVCL